VHDLFDVLGLSNDAPIGEIRRVCAQRARRIHPDFRLRGSHPPVHDVRDTASDSLPRDIAVDFVDVSGLTSRIETSFFTDLS
jgi:hypothetical protein